MGGRCIIYRAFFVVRRPALWAAGEGGGAARRGRWGESVGPRAAKIDDDRALFFSAHN